MYHKLRFYFHFQAFILSLISLSVVYADHDPHSHAHGPPHGHPHGPPQDYGPPQGYGPPHGYGPPQGYGPKIHCRNTTNTITAEVCVPVFTEKVTPITLAVKEVQDNEYLGSKSVRYGYCYDQIRTVCIVMETTNQQELCTYNYAPKTETLPAQVTKVR